VMKQLLNTLFVMTEDAYLALENDNVVIRGDVLLEVKNHDGCGCVRCEYGNP